MAGEGDEWHEERRMKSDDYIFVSDFDGTITIDDTNGMLFLVCGNEVNAQIEEDFIADKMSNREAMKMHFDVMKLSLADYHAFLDNHIKIDPGFDEFLLGVYKRKLPFCIVSAGFRQGVKRVLGEGRLSNIKVYANDLVGTERLSPVFAQEPNCDRAIGPCGNCKKAVLTSIKTSEGKKIIFIGDGLTDRCAIEEADIVFAKKALAKHCMDENIPYKPYKSFLDITKFLNSIE